MSDPPNVETRLEEMERRLAEIQRELAPEFPVRPVPAPAPPAPPAPPARPAGAAEAPAPPPAAVVEMSAGPFPGMDALREFERAVAELPGVREVAVRGYETGNRAILEVQLDPDTP
jgi:hypothetical protein